MDILLLNIRLSITKHLIGRMERLKCSHVFVFMISLRIGKNMYAKIKQRSEGNEKNNE